MKTSNNRREFLKNTLVGASFAGDVTIVAAGAHFLRVIPGATPWPLPFDRQLSVT